MKTVTPEAPASAERHPERGARLIDRSRFAALFRDGARTRALDALRVHQNSDGGLGNALEPDLRGPGTQPLPVEVAFRVFDELDAFGDPTAHYDAA
ncbi:hypothetical protein [Sphaerisporangium siamense]|uniref:Uncharacterized protein n=1 Tax=Sphaerisporangium siamense TaxID=795645 RepID=A0A7W7DAD6_9ACTN|nr:hypothetical protein [Sphaerisporangium siamense]MBB4703212.1 hypothetical protein [Sphaerisporangium siamense]